jgi:hypothetical protein
MVPTIVGLEGNIPNPFESASQANGNSIFYIGYMIGSLMWSKLVQTYPQYAGKFISGAVCVWSVLVLLTCRTAYVLIHRFLKPSNCEI